jgi:hypothetical protein
MVLGVAFYAWWVLFVLAPQPRETPAPESSFDTRVSYCDMLAEKRGWTDRQYYECVNLPEWRDR